MCPVAKRGKLSMKSKIKSYTDSNGKELFKFQIYLGKNSATGSSMYVKKRGFTSRYLAEKAYNKVLEDIKKGTYKAKSQKHYKIKDIAKRWLKYYRSTVKESTYNQTNRILNNHILSEFGNTYVDKLTVDRCEKAVYKWQNEAPISFKRFIRYTNNILDYAVNLEIIDKNPMKRVIRPKVVKKHKEFKDFYSKSELEKFLDCCKQSESLKVYLFFHLLAYTGMRKGEALALTWEDVNLSGATLTINKGLTLGIDFKMKIDTPKTVNSIRVIDLAPQTVAILKEWKHEQLKLLFNMGVNGLNKKQLIFQDAENKHIYPSKPTQWNDRICKKFNLRRIKIHGFRHTHASLLFEAGASMEEVKERLGHSSIKTTLDVYTHVTKDKKQETANKFASFMQG